MAAEISKKEKKSKKRAAAEALGENPDASTAGADTTMEVDAAAAEPKVKKSKKSKDKSSSKDADASKDKSSSSKDELVAAAQSVAELCPVAKPLAQSKLSKKVLRTVKKSSRQRQLKRGVKEVVKALRKKEKGIVVLAGDISPMDILTHLPVLAEDASCPYIFVSSKELLGQASSTKRPTSCVMMCPADLKSNPKMSKKAKEVIEKAAADQEKGAELKEYRENYDELHKEILTLDDAAMAPDA